MSANESNLSSAQYGYDFVVATTQASINGTMTDFLKDLSQPEVVICYVADAGGNPTKIDFNQLVQNSHGSNPFAVSPTANPETDQDLLNLYEARFLFGFKAQIGIPATAVNVPDIVTLGGDTTVVGFNLVCSEFQIVQYTPKSGYNPAIWFNESQNPESPWVFSSKVSLSSSQTGNYNQLPPAIQAQIHNLGSNSFSVEQLFFDLDNATLETIPTISGVESGTELYMALEKDFLGAYFATVREKGEPVLGFTITETTGTPSSLSLTDLKLQVNPYISNAQQVSSNLSDLTTLNYLCATNNNRLPAPANFTWNWIEPNEALLFDGVIAINRNTLARFFQNQLMPYVTPNCFQSWVRVWLSGFFDQNVHYDWSLTPGQLPNVTIPPTGQTVLQYSYSSTHEDDAGAFGGDMGKMVLTPSLNFTVDFVGNEIVITQHLVIYLYVRSLQTSADGNIVDRQIVDTYSIDVNDNILLIDHTQSYSTDNSHTPSTNGFLNFFTGLNDIINDVANWTRNFTSLQLSTASIPNLQSFIFPGGNLFTFKDGYFSNHQDLVAHIKYLK